MKLTPVGKIIFLVLAIGIAVGLWRLWDGGSKGTAGGGGGFSLPKLGGGGGSSGGKANLGSDQGLLGRPLRVGIVTWPGYAGGIVANGGFKPNKECLYWNNHKLLVEFLLMEDPDARSKAFARGGAEGVDIVWSTVDYWANELPGFIKGGVPAKAIMQVDWSQGGDAIVADQSIKRIEDLRGKKVSLVDLTPSRWLLEYSLQNSSLDDAAQKQIVQSLVGKSTTMDARSDFVANKVDATVVWEPDVTEALSKRPGAHKLVSTETASNLIADLMVAQDKFIKDHPDVVKAFVQGWFDGTEEANRKPERVVSLLMENEPLYKELGADATRAGLPTVKWADLSDNARMFGLDGSEPLFDRIFRQASVAWVRRGIISQAVLPSAAKHDGVLRQLYASVPKDVRVPVAEPKFPATPPAAKKTEPGVFTRPVNIYFATGSNSLDPNAKQVLDQVATIAQTFSNAYIRVEGNTDSTGNPQANVQLSQKRAESVVNYLVSRYKLNRARFIARGNGPNKPVASNATEAGRSSNRRTDVSVLPKD